MPAGGGKLRDYQLDGLNWMAYSWSKGMNGILADEVWRRCCCGALRRFAVLWFAVSRSKQAAGACLG